jgi:hypothetical protein
MGLGGGIGDEVEDEVGGLLKYLEKDGVAAHGGRFLFRDEPSN